MAHYSNPWRASDALSSTAAHGELAMETGLFFSFSQETTLLHSKEN